MPIAAERIRPILDADSQSLKATSIRVNPIFEGLFVFNDLSQHGNNLSFTGIIHENRCGPGDMNPCTLLREKPFREAVRWLP